MHQHGTSNEPEPGRYRWCPFCNELWSVAEVVPNSVEVETAVLPPRPLPLAAFRAVKSIQDRRIRREEQATRCRGR